MTYFEKNITDKKLILYGCGESGKKWLSFLGNDIVYGFADTNRSGEKFEDKYVFSIEELKEIKKEIMIFISTNKKNKEQILMLLKKENLDDIVTGYPLINKNVFIAEDAVINCFTEFEGQNAVLANSDISNCKIGYASYVGQNNFFYNIKIGKYCSIGPDVKIIRGQHPSHKFVSTHPIFYSTQQTIRKSYVKENKFEEFRYTEEGYTVEIGNDVWIGAGSCIMEGVKIADGTIVAAGANVVKDTNPYSIVGGNPAKIIKYRFNEEEVEFLKKLQWWNKSEKWILQHLEEFRDITALMKKVLDK